MIGLTERRHEMAKLYFKYGAMGSSKTAQALITKYNYEENDLNVWLIKPSADTRDGVNILRSRIGLEAQVHVVTPAMDVYDLFVTAKRDCCDVIIVDECQFMTAKQIDELRAIVNDYNVPVLCFGLLIGATLGGNLTPVGASANITAGGILRKAGYEVSTGQFMKIGVPFTMAAVLTGYVLAWFLYV